MFRLQRHVHSLTVIPISVNPVLARLNPWHTRHDNKLRLASSSARLIRQLASGRSISRRQHMEDMSLAPTRSGSMPVMTRRTSSALRTIDILADTLATAASDKLLPEPQSPILQTAIHTPVPSSAMTTVTSSTVPVVNGYTANLESGVDEPNAEQPSYSVDPPSAKVTKRKPRYVSCAGLFVIK